MVTARAMGPRFVQQGRAETLRLALTDDAGAAVPMSGATFTLIDADNEEIESGAATITNGAASYALLSTFADAYELPQGVWRERWEIAGVSGDIATPTIERDVYLCRVAPVQHVDVESLIRLHPQWARQLRSSRAAGRTGDPIALAWDELIARLLGDEILPQRVLNWHALSVVHQYWAASLVCRDFGTDVPEQSRWERLGKLYWDRSQSEYERIAKLAVDDDEDGIADRTRVDPATSPDARRWRWA